jgi:hypothetical protein
VDDGEDYGIWMKTEQIGASRWTELPIWLLLAGWVGFVIWALIMLSTS